MKNRKLYILLGIVIVLTLILSIFTLATLTEKPKAKTTGSSIIFVTTPQKTEKQLPKLGQSLTDQKKQSTIVNNNIKITINNHHSYNYKHYHHKHHKHNHKYYKSYKPKYYYPHYIIY
jgi:flagellar basal body-associated protein FliL